MAAAQLIMAAGHCLFAMGWPGTMYVGTLLVGLGYGSHWSIIPAAISELFGLKKFGALYNFITMANPAGSLIFSGVIASGIYDQEAERQAHGHHFIASGIYDQEAERQAHGHHFIPIDGFTSFWNFLQTKGPPKCHGTVCYFLTSLIMCGICIVAAILSLNLVYRARRVYTNLYGKPWSWVPQMLLCSIEVAQMCVPIFCVKVPQGL